MLNYDILLFDLDGTIIDSSLGITNSVMHALKKFGIIETDRKNLYKFIGPPLTDSFQKYYGFSKEKSIEAVSFYREYYHDHGIYECYVYHGLEDSLKSLKEMGKKLIVATSKPEPYARRIINHFNLDHYFEYVAGMEMNGGRGTKADVIAYALETMQINDYSKCLMIGDRKHDVSGAKKVGLNCVGVLYGFGNEEELRNAGAIEIVETPIQICEHFK